MLVTPIILFKLSLYLLIFQLILSSECDASGTPTKEAALTYII